MGRVKPRSKVVYVERGGDSSVKWLLWGAVIGAGVALLYAPRNGEETRRLLQRRLWKLRAMTEEKFDELTQQLGGRGGQGETERLPDLEGEDDDLGAGLGGGGEEPGGGIDRRSGSVRQDLERRLAEARARRRSAAADVEEPLA